MAGLNNKGALHANNRTKKARSFAAGLSEYLSYLVS